MCGSRKRKVVKTYSALFAGLARRYNDFSPIKHLNHTRERVTDWNSYSSYDGDL